MKRDRELLKLQAYLDHELSPHETARVAEWLANDSESRATYEELRQLKALMAGNELTCSVPESREFYWARIEQRIPSAAGSAESSRWRRWALRDVGLRLGIPLAGLAALVALMITIVNLDDESERVAASFEEIEAPIAESASFSFQAPEVGLTVVWIGSGGGN